MVLLVALAAKFSGHPDKTKSVNHLIPFFYLKVEYELPESMFRLYKNHPFSSFV
jgi:hypothetical protein